MNRKRSPVFVFSLLLLLVITSCTSAAPAATETPVPVMDTPLPNATNTQPPTDTPEPSVTPDVEATHKVETFQAILDKFAAKGYIGSAEGERNEVKDFEGEYALINNYYKWWPALDGEFENFVFSAHLEWQSYSSTPNPSGCGLGFGIQKNGKHYAVFLDRENIIFLRSTGSRAIEMGAAGGDRYPIIPIPAKSDLVVAVWGQNVTVSVDGVIVNYILASDQPAIGTVAFSLLSGGNSGYGTRCRMTDIVFWTPK